MYAMNWTSWGIAVTFTFLVAWTLPDMLRNARNLWYDWEAREQTIATRKHQMLQIERELTKHIPVVPTPPIIRAIHVGETRVVYNRRTKTFYDIPADQVDAWVKKQMVVIKEAGRPNDIQDAGYKWRIQVDHPDAGWGIHD